MREAVTAALLLIGGAFILLAAVGVLRLPDLFTRMQAATKAARAAS
jgi:multicomponent Na+:H+ antiporter subunit G